MSNPFWAIVICCLDTVQSKLHSYKVVIFEAMNSIIVRLKYMRF